MHGCTLQNVKDKIKDKTGVPPDHQLLTFNGRVLEGGHSTLNDYGIRAASTLELDVRKGSKFRACIYTIIKKSCVLLHTYTY